MGAISYRRHRFPPAVIRHAVWLYFRFTLSLRDVEDLLAERGIAGRILRPLQHHHLPVMDGGDVGAPAPS